MELIHHSAARIAAGFMALLCSSVSVADLPPFGQSSLSSETDIEIVLPVGQTKSGRYGFEGLEYTLGADPADPTKQTVQADTEVTGTLAFDEGSEASTLMLEWEQYHSQVAGGNCAFFGIVDTEGQLVSIQRMDDETTRFSAVPGPGDVTWTETLPLDQWVRLRLEFTARSGGPGSNDGTIVMKMEIDGELVTVSTITDHDMANISDIGLFLTEGSTLKRLAAWRRLVWDGTGLDVYGAATNTDSLWRDIGHQLGVMEPDEQGGVRFTVWVHYDVGLYGAAVTDYAADVQFDTDPEFPAPITQTITILPEDAYNGVATVDGLLPNFTYYVRAQLKRDGAVVATTHATSCKTISVPDGSPGKFHLVHGSCSRSNVFATPNLTFRTALSIAPSDTTVIFSHIGDLQYIDVMLEYERDLPPGPRNPNATDALFDRAYDHMFLSAEFNELASNATCWFMWDDHEVMNGRSGVGLGRTAPHPALFDMALDAADRWWGGRLLDGTSPDRYYFHVETARCMFIYLDVRTYADQVGSLLGPDQIVWVKDLLQTKPKELVFLLSPTTWSSGAPLGRRAESWHDHTVERDDIITHFMDNNPTGHLFLLSGDTHYGMHNTFDFQPFGSRVHGDWMSGTYATGVQDVDDSEWGPGAAYEADHIEMFGFKVGQVAAIRGYATVDIDEANLSVRIAFVDGVTGEEKYVVEELCGAALDLDGDGVVGVTDLLVLLALWGMDPGGPPDFDGDGTVSVTDLLELLAQWCPFG